MTSEDIFFVEELIEWVEIHLEKRPSLDEVARISGYSKWHLQRKFKKIAGIQLATYIRARILTRAAMLLRITQRPIIAISDELGFDSQQTFTRMFKQRFAITPNKYRSMERWDITGLVPRFVFANVFQPKPERVRIPTLQLAGIQRSVQIETLDAPISNAAIAMRDEILHDFFSGLNANCRTIYSVFKRDFQASPCCAGLHMMAVAQGDRKEIVDLRNAVDTITLDSREYISVSYQGSAKGCIQFSNYLFSHYLDELRINNVGSVEMELFELGEWSTSMRVRQIDAKYTYLISVD